MVPPPNQNTMGVCNHIILHILYKINSMLLNLLKIIDAPIQASHICYLAVSFKFTKSRLLKFILSSPKCLLASRLTLFRLSTFLFRIMYPLHVKVLL